MLESLTFISICCFIWIAWHKVFQVSLIFFLYTMMLILGKYVLNMCITWISTKACKIDLEHSQTGHQQDQAEQDFPLDSKLDDIPARQLAQPQGIFQEPAPKQGPSTNTCQTFYPNFILARRLHPNFILARRFIPTLSLPLSHVWLIKSFFMTEP